VNEAQQKEESPLRKVETLHPAIAGFRVTKSYCTTYWVSQYIPINKAEIEWLQNPISHIFYFSI